jgi:hypothetical protein
MALIVGIFVAVVLALLFLLFRAVGRMGQGVSPEERMRHSAGEGRRPGPRATGLN